MTTVRAAVVQAAPVAFNLEKTLNKTDRLLSEAAATGAELVVFPEAFVSCSKSKYDFDVVGHYARPDVFQLSVNERAMAPVIREYEMHQATATLSES
ncbi:MAG TPA: nitrilase-related carbon-nitrogen hydrolase [Rubrobacteraceae bacterium]|nr:nitrilase-related carbon-nitrogen hydrolase [Rubrobacteraceae bacterium]